MTHSNELTFVDRDSTGRGVRRPLTDEEIAVFTIELGHLLGSLDGHGIAPCLELARHWRIVTSDEFKQEHPGLVSASCGVRQQTAVHRIGGTLCQICELEQDPDAWGSEHAAATLTTGWLDTWWGL